MWFVLRMRHLVVHRCRAPPGHTAGEDIGRNRRWEQPSWRKRSAIFSWPSLCWIPPFFFLLSNGQFSSLGRSNSVRTRFKVIGSGTEMVNL